MRTFCAVGSLQTDSNILRVDVCRTASPPPLRPGPISCRRNPQRHERGDGSSPSEGRARLYLTWECSQKGKLSKASGRSCSSRVSLLLPGCSASSSSALMNMNDLYPLRGTPPCHHQGASAEPSSSTPSSLDGLTGKASTSLR